MTDYLSRAGKTILIMAVVVGSITYVQGLNKHAHSSPTGQTSTAQAELPQKPAQSFEDLLDAIEWVESRGDPNAVGDYKEIEWDEVDKALTEGHILYFPKGNYLWGNPNSPKPQIPQTVGAYQIHKIYVDDVNRIITLYMKDVDFRFTYKDRWDKDESRTMVGIYTNHYSKHYLVNTWQLGMSSNEAIARIHNGGPNGWKKESTKPYWAKVKARLEE